MTTQSETILSRYRHVEKEADSLGRVIGVRRLKPSEQAKAVGFTEDLNGSDEVFAPNGQKMLVPHRLPLLLAAAVCQIDDAMIPFPRSRGELDAIYDRLDEEGIAAASRAVAKLQGEAAPVDAKEEAKN